MLEIKKHDSKIEKLSDKPPGRLDTAQQRISQCTIFRLKQKQEKRENKRDHLKL